MIVIVRPPIKFITSSLPLQLFHCTLSR